MRHNPHLPPEAIALAIKELKRDRSVMSPANANREVYRLLKNGVKVSFRGKENEETVENVRIIDWNEPSNNDFFLASQFWISEVMESVENLLDESIATEGYVIRESSDEYQLVDLSKIDFEALKAKFEKSRKRIETEKLKEAINRNWCKWFA